MATYRSGGRLQKKCFTTKDAAESWAEGREDEALETGTRHELSDDERHVVIDCREQLAELGMSLREAVEYSIKQRKFAAKSVPVSQLIEEFREAKRREGRSKRYLDDLRYRLGRFQEDFGDRIVASIETDRAATNRDR